MAPSYFPLRWESTGDQWWYASPIDWAAANGLYDLVTELLHLDTNLLIKLTSLRRIRRLETVWDDEAHFQDVAKCRSYVARKLLLECETARSRTGHNHNNSLISAGYGGWLLYTAASAGDVDFVKELLGRDPLLVFGEREYGVTDMLYAAARGKNSEVFNILLDAALLRKDCISSIGKELDEGGGVFKRDMVNRAIHAAARGGNWEILKQLLGSVSHIVSYRDAQGCTVLHAAAGRGQVEVVRNLIVLPDIIKSTDAQGNTALHVASYRGYLPVVEILIQASPLLTMLTNHNGDTFLHMAVYGFRSPGFCRLDKHTELMKQLLSEKIVNMKDIINVRNNDGRTALHVAVIHDVKCDVVESLMSVPSIDLNICDADGMTPLDHLKQRPKSASSEVLIKYLISAGGISNCQDYMTRKALVTHLKTHGIGGSPGTSFRISDAEIFLYTGIENSSFDANNDLSSVRARLGATIRLPSYDLEVTGSNPGSNISAFASKAANIYSPLTPPGGSLVHSAVTNNDVASVESNSCSIEVNNYESANSSYDSKSSPANYAAKRVKNLLQWPRKRETKAATSELQDDNSVDSFCSRKNLEDFPTPLRQRYSKQCSLPNNKRTMSIRTFLPSPSAKKYFTASLMQGVIKVKPRVLLPFQGVSNSSHSLDNKQKHVDMGPSCSNRPIDDGGTLQLNYKQSSFNKKLMNRYFSFGAQG